MTATESTHEAPVARSPLRSVALPAEHGGWGLTVEPGILGLLVAPTAAGLCIAVGAVVAFLARTPVKIVLVDRRRGRSLERTRLAQKVAAIELAVLGALVGGAVALGDPWFWAPGAVALPLFAIEGWFEVRSRGRRLAPELAGAIGICSVAAMVVLADGQPGLLAVGLWMVLAARVATAIPHVRAQIAVLRHRPPPRRAASIGDLAAVVLAISAVGLDRQLWAGAVAIVSVVAIQRLLATQPVPRPVILGVRQMALGFGVVIVTALGVILSAT